MHPPRWTVPLVGLLVCSACSGEYLPVALTPDGAEVIVSESDPPPGCEEIGPVQASHGTQCSALRRTGTKDGAYVVLRNSAGARGANFVRVDREIPPRVEADNCLYAVRGVAFRCP